MERYVWEPGNSTRYELRVTREEGSLFGSSEGGGWLIVGPFPDHLRAMVVTSYSGVHWTYVAQKMGLGEVDASCVTVMIGKITDVDSWPSDDVNMSRYEPFSGARVRSE